MGRQRDRFAILLPVPILLLAIGLMPGERAAAQAGLGVAPGSSPAFRGPMEGGHNQSVSASQRIEAEIHEQGPSAELYSELGVALYRNHQPDKSLDAFTSMLKFRQPDSDELRIVALDYLELRDLPSADKWLHASIKLNPSDWRTWRYLGGVQFS